MLQDELNYYICISTLLEDEQLDLLPKSDLDEKRFLESKIKYLCESELSMWPISNFKQIKVHKRDGYEFLEYSLKFEGKKPKIVDFFLMANFLCTFFFGPKNHS